MNCANSSQFCPQCHVFYLVRHWRPLLGQYITRKQLETLLALHPGGRWRERRPLACHGQMIVPAADLICVAPELRGKQTAKQRGITVRCWLRVTEETEAIPLGPLFPDQYHYRHYLVTSYLFRRPYSGSNGHAGVFAFRCRESPPPRCIDYRLCCQAGARQVADLLNQGADPDVLKAEIIE